MTFLIRNGRFLPIFQKRLDHMENADIRVIKPITKTRWRNIGFRDPCSTSRHDYAFNWVFHHDGSLEMEMGSAAENLVAVHHQHFFSFRLDMDVDGTNNSVSRDEHASSSRGSVESKECPPGNITHPVLLRRLEQRASLSHVRSIWNANSSATRE